MSLLRMPDTLWSDNSIKINVTDLGSLHTKVFLELQSVFRAAFTASHFNEVSHPAAFPNHREMLLAGLDQQVGKLLFQKHIPLLPSTAACSHVCWYLSKLACFCGIRKTWLTFLLDTPSPPHPNPSALFFIFTLPLHFLSPFRTENDELQRERLFWWYFLPVKQQEASETLWENHFLWHY